MPPLKGKKTWSFEEWNSTADEALHGTKSFGIEKKSNHFSTNWMSTTHRSKLESCRYSLHFHQSVTGTNWCLPRTWIETRDAAILNWIFYFAASACLSNNPQPSLDLPKSEWWPMPPDNDQAHVVEKCGGWWKLAFCFAHGKLITWPRSTWLSNLRQSGRLSGQRRLLFA